MKRPRSVFKFLLLLTIVVSVAACGSYDLEVQNKTDEVIDIYIDDFYEGSVAPSNYLLIRHLSRGEHFIEAYDLDADLIVDDSIYLDDDSRWIIYESYCRFY